MMVRDRSLMGLWLLCSVNHKAVKVLIIKEVDPINCLEQKKLSLEGELDSLWLYALSPLQYGLQNETRLLKL